MKKIEVYQTSDGEIFTYEFLAEKHEHQLKLRNWLSENGITAYGLDDEEVFDWIIQHQTFLYMWLKEFNELS